jgi:hypothetical protein
MLYKSSLIQLTNCQCSNQRRYGALAMLACDQRAAWLSSWARMDLAISLVEDLPLTNRSTNLLPPSALEQHSHPLIRPLLYWYLRWCRLAPYPSAKATSSRQKSGMSGTTWPQPE